MPFCPECGGEMYYDVSVKRYICRSCGISLSYQELLELKDKMRQTPERDENEKRRKRRKDYLDWWFSKRE